MNKSQYVQTKAPAKTWSNGRTLAREVPGSNPALTTGISLSKKFIPHLLLSTQKFVVDNVISSSAIVGIHITESDDWITTYSGATTAFQEHVESDSDIDT
ncbi:hypothetical protein DPMN_144996 [Dreissena polymorpha]|uniref:Uncharacterized protein n=1 Tax=Dreissena polymorpha TaxID=45954 RepID=A0A9D4J0K4_DREPO|nr:hypothetical protein DPMN_144996 [Dreissena polymorpha]